MKNSIRLAYFVSHPIQYQVPLLRLVAAEPDIHLEVFFYHDFSLRSYYDRGFGKTFQWDTPLTGGYDFKVLTRWNQAKLSGDRAYLPAKAMGKLFAGSAKGQPAFDAVWVHGWGHICSLQAIQTAVARDIPVLMRGESNALGRRQDGFKAWIKQRALRRLFRQLSGFLAIGTLNRQFYLAHGVAAERVFPMPYTVDNAEFQARSLADSTEKLPGLRRELGLEPGRPVILFAAKLTDVKNPFVLLDAYRRLAPEGSTAEPEPYLLFVGDGVLREPLEKKAAETGWKSIKFLGFKNQSEMIDFYSLCDVFVLPSRFEPWGLVVNEAMSIGRTVVVSDMVGSAVDLVEDGVNGKIFPSEDAGALAEALRWALTHARVAGEASRRKMETWSYREDLVGLKQALRTVCRPHNPLP